jgi:PPP family 3-phenylpropionic acid transporter
VRSAALPRFILLYVALYAAFGIASPFLPAFLASRGLAPEQIGLLLALGTAARLPSGAFAGWIADRLQALRLMLALCIAAAAMAALGYAAAYGFWLLLVVALVHAIALAPTTTIADALALNASVPREGARGFEYGYVRGSGSAAFIAGSILAGQAIAAIGLIAIIPLSAALLVIAAGLALRVPAIQPTRRTQPSVRPGDAWALMQIPAFRRVALVAALILGSHAMHDGFGVIRWTEAGISPAVSSVLWSEQVAAEVLVFFLLGPALLQRLGPRGAMMLAGIAAAVRWIVIGATAEVWLTAFVEPLHGITFALLHLACMRVIVGSVPPPLAATAQAMYGSVAIGLASALLTMTSGVLYARLGAPGFWVMAALALLAVPVAWSLRYDPRS